MKTPAPLAEAGALTLVDMAGVDMAGVDMAGVDMAGVDMAGVDMTGVDVAGVAEGSRQSIRLTTRAKFRTTSMITTAAKNGFITREM